MSLPALTPHPPQSPQAQRDVGAAQRAFFQAATGVAAPAAAATAPKTAPVPSQTAPAQAIDPDRPLRPGSLLDIRI